MKVMCHDRAAQSISAIRIKIRIINYGEKASCLTHASWREKRLIRMLTTGRRHRVAVQRVRCGADELEIFEPVWFEQLSCHFPSSNTSMFGEVLIDGSA